MAYEEVTLYRWTCDECDQIEELDIDALPFGWTTDDAGDHLCEDCS